MTTMELNVSPLGQVEGDLDVRVQITDGVVSDAWTEAAMFRGFEIILKGKRSAGGLIMTRASAGSAAAATFAKACYALDTAWGPTPRTPPACATSGRPARRCRASRAGSTRSWARTSPRRSTRRSRPTRSVPPVRPYVGTSYQTGVTLSQHPVEIYAIFGGQWPHSSFMIPGGVMSAPTLSDVTRSTSILRTGAGSGSRASGSAARWTGGWRTRPGATSRRG